MKPTTIARRRPDSESRTTAGSAVVAISLARTSGAGDPYLSASPIGMSVSSAPTVAQRVKPVVPAHERAPARRPDLLRPARLGEQQAQRLAPGAADEDGAVLGRGVGAGQARGDVAHVVGAVPGARRVDERAAVLPQCRAALLPSDAVHEEHGAVVPLRCHTTPRRETGA